MGFRETLAKANWELNIFLKTGKMPAQQRSRVYPTPETVARYNAPRTWSYQATSPYQMAQVPCSSCGTLVSAAAQFCHRCGRRAA
ncbi:MAG: zinc ribbon domain-containing protein [Candidatus Bathyarchaeia archaeon]